MSTSSLGHAERLLSEDILRIIFKDPIRTTPGEWDNSSPWVVSAVCQRWRNLALENPDLWSHIHFRPEFCTEPAELTRIRLSCARIEIKLLRSRSCSLNMTDGISTEGRDRLASTSTVCNPCW
ncbi:hypothetical protein BDV98DRAFT_575164 [Pterulicium gracile]|uniref:Uncharacterized protein n=1 Tax=Pterulicium gracile TaxID=1884261 RepID=A0A5C3QFI3_9AGAR|nr:hypothetical protein BDV98DRAFT_575164 [Pterula gracilis]